MSLVDGNKLSDDEDPVASEQITEANEVADHSWSRGILAVLIAWVAVGLFLLESPDPPSSTSTVDPSWSHGFLFFWIALVAVTWYTGAQPARYRRGLVALSGVAVFAAGTELAQTALDVGRRGEMQDFAADAAGIALAGVAAALLFTVVRRRRMSTLIVGFGALTTLLCVGVLSLVGDGIQTRWECRSTASGDIEGDLSGSILRIHPQEGVFVDSEGEHAYSGVEVPFEGDRLRCAVAAADEFTIVVRLTTANIEQSGPTRILTSSTGIDNDQVNFHVGQEGEALSIRLRPGPNRGATWLLAEDIFVAGSESTITVSYSDGDAAIYVDGQFIESLSFEHGSLLGWDESFPLLVGDEFTGDRRFQGAIHEIAILDRALLAREVANLR